MRAPGCDSTWRCLTVGLITCSALRARGPRRRQSTGGVDRQWVGGGGGKPQQHGAPQREQTRTSGGGPVSVSMWPGLSRHLAPHTLDFWRGHVLWQATSSLGPYHIVSSLSRKSLVV